MSNKSSIAFLLKYLYENTDMDHPVTSVQLKSIMIENGYAADPRTIRKDAAILTDIGFDIIITEQNGIPTQYSYGSKEWDITELMILIDAVSSAQFITQAKTEKLIDKISILAGKQYKTKLTPKVFVSEHIKAENDILLYTIDKIALGITNKKKIAFRIFNYNTDKQKILRHDGEVYILSPYNTVWKDDRYYVIGYSDKRKTIISVRIDRMEIPTLLEEDAVPPPNYYNIQDYSDVITKMYNGLTEEITLRCKPNLIDNIIDKFGKNVNITNITPEFFEVTTIVAVSETFLAWAFQYAGEMIILSPESARKKYTEMLLKAAENMNTCESDISK